jgi:hypothetical protein
MTQASQLTQAKAAYIRTKRYLYQPTRSAKPSQ